MDNPDHRKSNELVTGPSGSGKTTLALARFAAHKARRKVVFDSQLELAKKLGVAPVESPDLFCHQLRSGQPVIVFQPGVKWPDLADAFRYFLAVLFAACAELPGVTLVFIDELQDFVPQGMAASMPTEFRDVLQKGRRREIDLLCACQSANQVNGAIRGQLTEVFTFKQTEPTALKFLELCGLSSAEIGALDFERHEWLSRNLQTGVTSGSRKGRGARK